ncbi:EF-hand domain-containing protein [Saccharothrix variisporea]|uniref:Ca2+-binding EF-hand superfamily protein n=1 Tax=Saccharothrix variisporea TaxID=543527 RepID=A0A495X040_9PSEU|nr:EF-hand domain-containing protein [Saccharothrix variisporea]RKT67312.1 Ca2+-binding EF-hand superfamily protein [Saccharothrix variisporea]
MSTSFLDRKIRRGFDRLDSDRDGRLTWHDHVVMGERTAAGLGYGPRSDVGHRIIEAYCRVWERVHRPHDADGDGSVTREEFAAAVAGAAGRAGAIADLAAAVFEAADADGDGRIGFAEYLAFLRGHQPDVPEEEAAEAFGHLDRDGDGAVGRAEVATAIVEYWTSGDPDAPGNWFYGRPPSALSAVAPGEPGSAV